ncbi:MAG: DUF445 domain-containing protein [Gammaproteobacteria bacterium]|nr:DUF445 domain-containing protein [Gammaproteobacteria bacterium]MAY01753.1 DUF445 domain-containing protein [Gammaproteobacteria bacterium]|tara:strand:+ start:710 stop:1420 length:711 start_codon:yes stop_codon:yes gene_type:complete
MPDKAVLTNLTALLIVGIALLVEIPYQPVVLNTGLFALSGGVTNWLAVHMLFEKVPGFYGSGVIPARFEEFKFGIKKLIMEQFFTPENIQRFINQAEHESEHQDKNIARKMAEKVDFSGAYDSLVDVIMNSSFGGMLSMVGGSDALKPLREPFINKMQDYVGRLAEDREFLRQFRQSSAERVISRVEIVVDKRLDELTPQLVKEIIQQMIRRHLGWLVVWGGVIGGLIGLLVSLLL